MSILTPEAWTSMPHPFLAQKTSVILKKRWPNNDSLTSFLFLSGEFVTLHKLVKKKRFFSHRVSDTQLFHLLICLRRKCSPTSSERRIISKEEPRRPLLVAGHCRRLLLLLRRSYAAATELMLRAARVPPRGAAASLLEVLPAAPPGGTRR